MKNLILFICWVISLIMTMNVDAVPYVGNEFTYYQPDGEAVQVRLFGDEFYAVEETLDGRVIVKNPTTRELQYAELSPDGREFLPTGIRVGKEKRKSATKNEKDRVSKLTKKERIDPKSQKEKSDAMRKKRHGFDDEGRFILSAPQLAPAPTTSTTGTTSSAPAPAVIQPAAAPKTGNRVGLVLMAQFPDHPEDVTITRAQTDDFFNVVPYSSFGNATSIRGYFDVQSKGQLDLQHVVTAYFTAAHPRSYYADPTITFGGRIRELIIEGLEVLKSQNFDFTQLDGDNNGAVDCISCLYAGIVPNTWSEGLWPSASSLSWTGFSDQRLNISSPYQITSLGSTLTIGMICHELGHAVAGFPDLYPYGTNVEDTNAADVGAFCVMGGGAYGSDGKHPTNISAPLKYEAGWATLQEATNSATFKSYTLEADGTSFVRFLNPANSNEYFMAEMRANAGYEGIYGGDTNSVCPSPGLVIYHCLTTGSNTNSSIFTAANPNCDYTTPYKQLLIENNPTSSCTPWYDDPTPDANDAFVTGDGLTSTTTPALKFWSATGRTVTSGANINLIKVSTSSLTFRIGPNTAPTATAQTNVITAEDTSKAITLAGTDAQSDTLTYTVVAAPSHGTLVGTAPNLTYVPTANYNGSDSFTFRTNDGTLNSALATVSITITPVYDAPAATPQSVTLWKNIAKVITLQGTADDRAITYTIVTQPTSGTLSGSAPNVTYTPATNYTGTTSFTFRINDGTTNSAPATVTITVIEPETIFTGVTSTDWNTSTNWDAGLPTGSIYMNISAGKTAINFSATPAISTGKLILNSGAVLSIPNNAAVGENTVITSPSSIELNGGTIDIQSAENPLLSSLSMTGTGKLTGASGDNTTRTLNNAVSGSGLLTIEGRNKQIWNIGATNSSFSGGLALTAQDRYEVKFNAAGSAGTGNVTVTPRVSDNRSAVIVLGANNVFASTATLTLNGKGADSSTGWTYTGVIAIDMKTFNATVSKLYVLGVQIPNGNYTGGSGTWITGTGTLTVGGAAPNTAPVASAQNVSTTKNTDKAIALSGSDAEGSSLTYTIVTQPSHGTLSGTAPNVTYTPTNNYTGSDSFTFRVRDGALDSTAATVSITVTDTPTGAITWGAATTVTAASDIQSAGVSNLAGANFGITTGTTITVPSTETGTVNVEFKSLGSGQNVTLSNGINVAASSDWRNWGLASANSAVTGNFGTVLDSNLGIEVNDPVATSATITLSGLSIGTQYQIQFFADSTKTNSQTISGAGTMDSLNGQFVKGTFTANATSLVLTVTRNTDFAVANALTIGTVGSVVGQSYDDWAAQFLGLTNRDATVDFDKGGLPTGIERVLGGNPTSSTDDASIAPIFGPIFGSYAFIYRRSDAAYTDPKTTISVEYTSDFINWTTATAGTNITITENPDYYGAGVDSVTVIFAPAVSAGGKVFVRLKSVISP